LNEIDSGNYADKQEAFMPEKETLERAHEDEREGKSPSTQAGEFVKEEMLHIREGKHGAVSTKQAIAIGLLKARRAGVKLRAPGKGSAKVKKQAARDYQKGQSQPGKRPSRTRSRAVSGVLKREGRSAASHRALSRQAHNTARTRGAAAQHQSALKAVRTKGSAVRSQAAKKAARTRSQSRKAA
jgi:hypothetical protein